MTNIGPNERAVLSDALTLSPVEFAGREFGDVSIFELSDIFKRVISHTLGRPVGESRPLVANMQGQK
jgi:hypothetical protein